MRALLISQEPMLFMPQLAMHCGFLWYMLQHNLFEYQAGVCIAVQALNIKLGHMNRLYNTGYNLVQ